MAAHFPQTWVDSGRSEKVSRERRFSLRRSQHRRSFKIVLLEGGDRAGFQAFPALLAGSGETSLGGFYQRMVPEFGFGHKASQPASASHGCNQHAMDTKSPEPYQMSEMFVGPARHEVDLVKVMSGRGEARFEAVLREEVPKSIAHTTDQVVRLHIGNPPVPAWPVAFLVFLDEISS